MDDEITLDIAKDVFDHNPSDKSCAAYLRQAIQYHRDEMIADDTLRWIVERIAEWLADE